MAIIDISFVVIFITTIIIVLYLLKLAKIKLFSVTIPSIVVGSLLVFDYIGLIPMYFQLDDYVSQANDLSIIYTLLFVNSFSLIALVVGFIFAKYIFNLKNKKNINKPKYLTNRERIYFFIILFFCIIVIAIYLSKVPKIAIISALFEGAEEAKLSRSLMTNDFAGKLHRYNFFMTTLPQIISFIFFSSFLRSKKKSDKYCFMISFFVSSFSAVMSTQKAPFAWYVISLFFVWCLCNKNGRIPIKSLIVLSLSLILAVLIPFYILFMGSKNIERAITGLVNRIFCAEIISSYYYIKYIPRLIPFLYGTTFTNPGGIFPYKPYRLTIELMYKIHPELMSRGIVGTAPTIFWGEAYANFGWFGVVFPPLFIGIYLYILNNLLNCMKDTPLRIAFLVCFSLRYKDLAVAGLFSFLTDEKIILFLLFYYMYLVICHPVWKKQALFKSILVISRK